MLPPVNTDTKCTEQYKPISSHSLFKAAIIVTTSITKITIPVNFIAKSSQVSLAKAVGEWGEGLAVRVVGDDSLTDDLCNKRALGLETNV